MNYLVFNTNADTLQTTIYGTDTDELKPIAVDANGMFLFSPLSQITVTASNLDIRNLTPSRDTVSVTANNLDIRDLNGAQDSVQKQSCGFVEQTITATAPSGSTAYLVRDIGPYSQNSYFIRNTGSSTITVSMQIAPLDDPSYYFTAAGPTTTAGPKGKERGSLAAVPRFAHRERPPSPGCRVMGGGRVSLWNQSSIFT